MNPDIKYDEAEYVKARLGKQGKKFGASLTDADVEKLVQKTRAEMANRQIGSAAMLGLGSAATLGGLSNRTKNLSTLTRRGFIGLGLAGLAGCAMGTDKSTLISSPGAPAPDVHAGVTALYYGPTTDSTLQGQLSQYDTAIVEPALTPPALISGGKAMGYSSLVDVNTSNGYAPLQTLIAQLRAVAPATVTVTNPDGTTSSVVTTGFLQDSNKNIITNNYDTKNDSLMVDLRNPTAYNLMYSYLTKLADTYPQGVFLDDIDYAVSVENEARLNDATRKQVLDSATYTQFQNVPQNSFNGLTDKAVQLMDDVCNYVAAAKKKAIINGGFEQRTDQTGNVLSTTTNPEVIASVAAAKTNYWAKESFYWESPETQWDASDQVWLASRMAALFQGIQNAGKSNVGYQLIMNEPCTDGQQHNDIESLASTYQTNLIDAAKSGGVNLGVQLYVSNLNHNVANDVAQNIKDRGVALA